jgi:hypothetical protein
LAIGASDQKSTGDNTGKHPGSENLKPPWPKGKSGNPKGRRKGSYSLRTILRQICQEPGKDRKTKGEELMAVLMQKALTKPDANLLKLIIENVDGKLPETVLAAMGLSAFEEIDDAVLDRIIAAGKPKDDGEVGQDSE